MNKDGELRRWSGACEDVRGESPPSRQQEESIDQHRQDIDVLVSKRRDGAAARAFFARALRSGPSPIEVTSDRAPPSDRSS